MILTNITALPWRPKRIWKAGWLRKAWLIAEMAPYDGRFGAARMDPMWCTYLQATNSHLLVLLSFLDPLENSHCVYSERVMCDILTSHMFGFPSGVLRDRFSCFNFQSQAQSHETAISTRVVHICGRQWRVRTLARHHDPASSLSLHVLKPQPQIAK